MRNTSMTTQSRSFCKSLSLRSMSAAARTSAFVAGVAALALLAAAPEAAQAASPQSLDQILGASPTTDKSLEMLRSVLGDFALKPWAYLGGSSTLLGALFTIFNGAMFIIAVWWGTWNIMRGIVGTAHEGQVLGKQLNAVWLPIRMVTGVVSIVPVFGGFNFGQVMLMLCAMLGIGTANMMWSGAVSATGQFTAMLQPSIASPMLGNSMREAAYGQFAMEVCRLAKADEEAAAAAAAAPTAPIDMIRPLPLGGEGILGGAKFGTLSKPGLCGSVGLYRKGTGRAPTTFAFRVAAVNYDAIRLQAQSGYAAAYNTFQTRVNLLAQQWYRQRVQAQGQAGAASVPVPVDQIHAAITAYGLAAQLAAEAAAKSSNVSAISDAAMNQMREQGWAAAGAWYATFAEVNAAIADAVRSVDVRVTNPEASSSSLASEAFDAFAKGVADGQKSATAAEGDSGFSVIKLLLGERMGANAVGEWSLGQKIVELVSGGVSSGSGGGGLINPIIMFKNLGDYLMLFGEAMHITVAVLGNIVGGVSDSAATASKVLSAGGLLGKAASLVLDSAAGVIKGMLAMLPMLATFAIGLGALMAIYIPMVPFITWMGGIVQWAVVLFEGLVAMTLGALAHMDGDGEGMGQRAERTYVFMLNVLARPACMLLGFFMASAIMIALGTFQAQLFVGAMANAQGNSITGIVSILGYLTILFVLNWTLIQGLFNMIFLIPDNVIGMIGAGHSAELGREVEGKMHNLFLNFTNKTGGALAQGMSKNMQNIGKPAAARVASGAAGGGSKPNAGAGAGTPNS